MHIKTCDRMSHRLVEVPDHRLDSHHSYASVHFIQLLLCVLNIKLHFGVVFKFESSLRFSVLFCFVDFGLGSIRAALCLGKVILEFFRVKYSELIVLKVFAHQGGDGSRGYLNIRKVRILVLRQQLFKALVR